MPKTPLQLLDALAGVTPRVHPEMNKDVISVTHRNPADHTATATVDYFPNSITL
jgi:hypothetical protein